MESNSSSGSSRNSSPRKKGAQKFIDEEEDAQDKIIESLTSKYTELDSVDLLDKTLEHLRENIKPGICLICIENVEKEEAIWSCAKCYCILHLVCIQRWAKDSIANAKETAAYKDLNIPIVWCCPKCRGENAENEFPNLYKCFCGKVDNPKNDPWNAPHSCGDTCGKPLKPECGHRCILLCHSGACPPCPKQITTSCHCGKSDPKMLRCFAKSWSCGTVCSNVLACGEHPCPQICHAEDCPQCLVPVTQPCSCSSPQQITFPCSQLLSKEVNVSCGNDCRKILDCGIHRCTQTCHEEDCGPCEQSCPCGKKRVQCAGEKNRGFGKPCEDTCGKVLDCGEHHCEQKCHAGNCGTCLQSITKRCKCGQYEKEVLCSKEFACTTKCRRMRDCGVHTCNKKCCAGDCPPCRNPCGKSLQCKNHKCEMICHRGACYPCPVNAPVKCYCGQTVRYVPCGSEKKCRPPDCHQPCQRSSKCDHPAIQKHKCHYAECPKCRLVCGKTLACGHTCPNSCHSFKLNKKACFKCLKLVPSKCSLHPQVQVQCHKQDEACEEICGKSLSCGVHFCQKRCHVSISEDCGLCQEACSKERPGGCEHECSLGCHPGPCSQCTLVAKITCHCEGETLFVTCFKQHHLSETERSCKNQCPRKLNCGHRCLSLCHSGDCPPLEKCRRKVKVNCRCKVFKKEVECFLLGDSKVLECSAATCHPTTKSPSGGNSSGNKGKKKGRHKKSSESNDASSTSAGNEAAARGKSEGEKAAGETLSKSEANGYMKPVIFAAVLAVTILTGIVVNSMGSSTV